MINEVYKRSCTEELSMRSAICSFETMQLVSPIENGAKAGFRMHELHKPNLLSRNCIECLCTHFSQHPFDISSVPRDQHLKLLDTLSTQIDPVITAIYVQEDHYWKRCCKEHQIKDDVSLKSTWKTHFLEAELTKRIEDPNPDIESLTHFLSVIYPYVTNLHFSTNPSHISLQLILSLLPQLSSINISYGLKGIAYNPSIVGMTIQDIKSMVISRNIMKISLPSNHLTDDVIRHFSLSSPSSLESLDISHNYISNSGLRYVFGQLTIASPRLKELNVSDNFCHAEGGRIISRWLPTCPTLKSLHANMNQVMDDGGSMILSSTVNSAVCNISMASCGLGSESVAILTTLLVSAGCQFARVDVSGNDIDERQQEDLVRGLENNNVCVEFHMKSDNDLLQSRIRDVELRNLRKLNK